MTKPTNSNTSPIGNLVEEWADKMFHETELPHAIRDVSVWHLLMVSEDLIRMHFIEYATKPAHEIEGMVDQLKYSLKHCLEKIFKNSKNKDPFPIPKKTTPKVYIKSGKLLNAGLVYAKMVRIFISVHCGHARIEAENSKYVLKVDDKYDVRYSALEILGHGQEDLFDISTLLYSLLSGKFHDAELTAALTDGVRVKKGQVVCEYGPREICSLINLMPQRPILIPNDFIFAWGSAYETQALINALHTRCLYHLLSIDFAMHQYKRPGGFEDSLVLQTTRAKLIEELSYLADFGERRISDFIDFLTYGYKCKTPDPALQPIIPTKNGKLLIPCAHIITCNAQRNILSLMARIDSSEFDGQSDKFENKMVEELFQTTPKWVHKVANKTFKAAGQREEIDLLIVDKEAGFILVFELRWMLQPGDPREVLNKIGACSEKVKQLTRKIEFLKINASKILPEIFNINQNADQFRVQGVVVLQGFGGQISQSQNIPIITLDVLKIGLLEIFSLPSLYEWIKSLAWLPQSEVHFSPNTQSMETEPEILFGSGFLMTGNAAAYAAYVQKTAVNAKSLVI